MFFERIEVLAKRATKQLRLDGSKTLEWPGVQGSWNTNRLGDDRDVRPEGVQVDRVCGDAVVVDLTFGRYASQECKRQRALA